MAKSEADFSITLRAYIEAILEERHRLQEQRFQALERNVEKEDDRFRHLLEGFPQLYSTKTELEQLRILAQDIKEHLVGREAFDDLKEKLDGYVGSSVTRDQYEELRTRVDTNTGLRTSILTAAAVVMTLIVVMIGYAISQIPTHDQISAQIRNESPWFADKPLIQKEQLAQNAEIQILEGRVASLEEKVSVLCKIHNQC